MVWILSVLMQVSVLAFGRIIAGLDGQFGLVDVQKLGNPKNMNFSIVVGYKF